MNDNENPGGLRRGSHSPRDDARGFPGTPPPAPTDPSATLPGPNTAGYLPGGHRPPEGSPLPTPFDPDRGYAPGPIPLGRDDSPYSPRAVRLPGRIGLVAGGLVLVIGIALAFLLF